MLSGTDLWPQYRKTFLKILSCVHSRRGGTHIPHPLYSAWKTWQACAPLNGSQILQLGNRHSALNIKRVTQSSVGGKPPGSELLPSPRTVGFRLTQSCLQRGREFSPLSYRLPRVATAMQTAVFHLRTCTGNAGDSSQDSLHVLYHWNYEHR